MDTERGVVVGVVGLVLATVLVSGPVVGAIGFTSTQEYGPLGSGNATVDDVSLPANAEITQGRFGSGEHYLRVPDGTAEFVDVEGRPLLSYELSIPGLDYGRTTTHLLTPSHTGTYRLSLQRDALEPAEIERRSYEGRLRVSLRSNGDERQLATRTITVEVTT